MSQEGWIFAGWDIETGYVVNTSITITARWENPNYVPASGINADGSVYIGNKTYRGYISSSGESFPVETKNAKFIFDGTVPDKMNVITDGFFSLKGTLTSNQLFLRVYREIDGVNFFSDFYIEKANFDEKIWLRFGKGKYDVWLYDAKINRVEMTDKKYIGEILNSDRNYVCHFNVDNIAEDTCEDAMWTMPSYECQSFDPVIKDAIDGSFKHYDTERLTDRRKLLAIHDWILEKLSYDYDSINVARKAQNSEFVIHHELAVCDGYTHLFIAMARYAGFKAKFIVQPEHRHSYARVLTNGEWKDVDVTWDDMGVYSDNYFLTETDSECHSELFYGPSYDELEEITARGMTSQFCR